jgi:uncharacterized protein YbjT (DUF2867 family)
MILITGASGNVGGEVLKQIAATRARVRAAFQSVSKAAAAPSGVEVVTMDYNQPQVSPIDIRDIAAAAVKTLTEDGHEGKAYTLTGPEALSNAQVAEILSEGTGREIRYVDLAPERFKQALPAAGVPEWSANALIDLQQHYRRGGASAVTHDVEQLLGRKPISFERFSRDYAEAFRPREQAAS